MSNIITILISFLLGVLPLLTKRFTIIYRLIQFSSFLLTKLVIPYLRFDKVAYTEEVASISHYLDIAVRLSSQNTDTLLKDKEVLSFISSVATTSNKKFINLMKGSYVLGVYSPDLIVAIKDFSTDHTNLEVRKLTTIAIDCFGNLFDLKDKLSNEYFQHLIYAINKCLIYLRDGGYEKRNLKKVSSTLFRLYKLTKAYDHLIGLKKMTEEDFNARINGLVSNLLTFSKVL